MTRQDTVDCTACRHRSGAGFDGLDDQSAIAALRCRSGRSRTSARQFVPVDSLAALTVYSGICLLLHASEGGTLRPIRIIWPGDLVVCLDAPDRRRLLALTDATCCRFETAAWPELMAVPELAGRVAEILARQLCDVEAMMASVCALPAPARVCRLLVDAWQQLSRRKLVSGPAFDLPLQRMELAALAGLTPTHLRRTLLDLSRRKVLDFEKGRVEFSDLEAAAALAELSNESPAPWPLL